MIIKAKIWTEVRDVVESCKYNQIDYPHVLEIRQDVEQIVFDQIFEHTAYRVWLACRSYSIGLVD